MMGLVAEDEPLERSVTPSLSQKCLQVLDEVCRQSETSYTLPYFHTTEKIDKGKPARAVMKNYLYNLK